MGASITITSITGTSPYQVYVCNVLGANCSYVGSATTMPYTVVLPAMYNSAPAVMIKVIDANNCETFIISPCTTQPTPVPTATPIPTPTPVPTNTPIPTATPTATPTQTPIGPTPTQTPIGPTPTPTQTPTPTPTPTPVTYYAYLIIDPYNERVSLNNWMSTQGSSWRGYNINAPSTVQATFDSQFSNYLDYTGWGVTSPAIRTAPISST